MSKRKSGDELLKDFVSGEDEFRRNEDSTLNIGDTFADESNMGGPGSNSSKEFKKIAKNNANNLVDGTDEPLPLSAYRVDSSLSHEERLLELDKQRNMARQRQANKWIAQENEDFRGDASEVPNVTANENNPFPPLPSRKKPKKKNASAASASTTTSTTTTTTAPASYNTYDDDFDFLDDIDIEEGNGKEREKERGGSKRRRKTRKHKSTKRKHHRKNKKTRRVNRKRTNRRRTRA